MRPFVLVLLTASVFPLASGAREPVRAKHAMVVAQEPLAAEVGARVLRAGGNAVDAAAAVGMALAVTYPNAGNIGGGGFLLARFADGRTTFVDFRERAPGSSSRDMYIDKEGKPTRESIEGWRASGVPGTVKGLSYAQAKYGKAKWADLVSPAVQLARDGFVVPYGLALSLKSSKLLGKFPESARVFLHDGKLVEAGDRFVQPELARTLERIAKNPDDFYDGEIAKAFAMEVAKNGGAITLDDLKNYKAVERVPLTGKYKGYDLITAPPPSSGGVGILQMMGVLEGSGYEKSGAGSAAAIHFGIEAMRRYYADRSEYLGDPDFFKVPLRSLVDPGYVKQLRSSIDPDRATPSSEVHPGTGMPRPESTETTALLDCR